VIWIFDFQAAGIFPAAFFVSRRRYRPADTDRNGIVVLSPARKSAAEKSGGGSSAKIRPPAP
jgi:hypothetical protein